MATVLIMEQSEAIIVSYWIFGGGGHHRGRIYIAAIPQHMTTKLDTLAHKGMPWQWPEF